MKIEHTLNPTMQAYVRAGIDEVNRLRREYWQFLGQAKEAEMAAAVLQAKLSEQLGLIQQSEGLPAPIAPYRLNDDATKLIGEVPDPAPAAVEPVMAAPYVNGVPRVAEHAG
jgi:hypothetical protein